MGLIHKTNSKITKAKAEQLQFYVINQCHNKQNLYVFALFLCAHNEPSNKSKHDVHLWLHVYIVGSYDWHRLYFY